MKHLALLLAFLATPALADTAVGRLSEKDTRQINARVATVDKSGLEKAYVEVLKKMGCSYSVVDDDQRVEFSRVLNARLFDMVDLPARYRDTHDAQGIGAGQQDDAYFRLKAKGVVRFDPKTKVISLTSC